MNANTKYGVRISYMLMDAIHTIVLKLDTLIMQEDLKRIRKKNLSKTKSVRG